MTIQLAPEQTKRLMEWCGFRVKEHILEESPVDKVTVTCLTSPLGERLNGYPPVTLDFLFEFAVPKLKVEYRNWKSVLHDWVDDMTGETEKDAIALFWLISEVIK